MKRLVRPEDGRVLGGVCAGIAKYYDEDVAIVRLITILLLVAGVAFWAYMIAWIVIPSEDEAN